MFRRSGTPRTGSAPDARPSSTRGPDPRDRDTQLRFLEKLASGDRVQLEAVSGARHDYAVMDALVVDARDVEVLEDAGEARLTLVTCFPFDAVVPGGPLRYVVRAVRSPAEAGPVPADLRPDVAADPPVLARLSDSGSTPDDRRRAR